MYFVETFPCSHYFHFGELSNKGTRSRTRTTPTGGCHPAGQCRSPRDPAGGCLSWLLLPTTSGSLPCNDGKFTVV